MKPILKVIKFLRLNFIRAVFVTLGVDLDVQYSQVIQLSVRLRIQQWGISERKSS